MNKIEELQQLKALLDSGALTQEEFETEKQKILSRKEEEVTNRRQENPSPQPDMWEIVNSFWRNSKLDVDSQQWLKKTLRIAVISACALLFIFAIFNMTFEYYMALSLALIALLLAVATSKTKGLLPKIINFLLILITAYNCIKGYFGTEYFKSYCRHINACLFLYWGYIIVLNFLMPSNVDRRKRLLCTGLLMIPFNPILWASKLTGAIVLHDTKYSFIGWHLMLACIALVATIIIMYCLLTNTPFNFIERKNKALLIAKDYINRIKIYAKNNKAVLIKLAIAIFVIITGIAGCSVYKHYAAKEKARQNAIIKAREDSIAAVKKAEADRIAAIKKAREDSIAAIEQARQDSIDAIEHAAFVNKYANIGLIITDVTMTRGRDNDGDITKGVKFSIFNPTKKTIKYVICSMVAINGVGDVMSYEKNCRGIGPVEPHDYATWNFDDIFYDKNDVIDDLKGSFRVIYTNGSSKNVRLKDAWVNSYDFEDYWFY